MYGFFIQAFERFITYTYGKDHWEMIRSVAGSFHDHFDESLVYDDNMIYEIMDAACDHLDKDMEELQDEFGEMYFSHCMKSNHGKFLEKLGGNLFDFLSNIDSLHDHLAGYYAGMKIPSFRVQREPDSRMSVAYYSDRDDLESITPGIIRQAALVLFNLEVEATFEMIPYKMILIRARYAEDASRMFPRDLQLPREIIPCANDPKIAPTEFIKVFPFHMVFDEEMYLMQLGAVIQRILNINTHLRDEKVTKYFTITRPNVDFDCESIKSRLNNLFVLPMLTNQAGSNPMLNQAGNNNQIQRRRGNLRLKGQMIYMEEKGLFLFLCSPDVSNIRDMSNKGLCLSDIPIHDATRDLVLLSENIQKEIKLTQQLGIVSDHLKKIHTEFEDQLYLYNRLLYAVLPSSIAKKLGEGSQVKPEKFLHVTLMFSGIVDFSSLCQAHDSKEVVHILNDLYIRFDNIISLMNYNEEKDWVYKVETIGDKYMTASGVPDKMSNDPIIICGIALDMQDAAQEVQVDGKPIQVTFGIHSGEIVAGVIGQKMPRYCLFGNSVNLASRTETTGIPGRINVTEDTYRQIDFHNIDSPDYEKINSFLFQERGKVKMKGKSEPMTTYTLQRKIKRSIPMSPSVGSFPHSNSSDVLASPGNNQEYFSLYRKPKSGSLSKKYNKRNFGSRFSTPGHSQVGTPDVRSRCSSGFFPPPLQPPLLSGSFYTGNGSIYEGNEPQFLSSVSTKDFHTTREDNNSDVATPVPGANKMQDSITQMLNEVNKALEAQEAANKKCNEINELQK